MFKFIIAFFCSITLLAAGGHAKVTTPALTVKTDHGSVAGVVRNGALEFRGIPFAAAPTGDLRWELPQAPIPWTATLDASAFGSACPQQARFDLTDASLNEDCLFLNVSVPQDIKPHEKLPVFFWIHGGAFVGGASNLYRLDKLATQGRMVVVSTNYRLGVFGFMPHPAFAQPNGVNGNYGLEDQRAAMRWVQRNIASFGGDPANVTIAGESAGAGSVCAHLSSPEHVKGLFNKAIILSAGCTQPLKTIKQAEITGKEISDALGCTGSASDVLACLRHDVTKASVANLLKAQGEYAAKYPADVIPFSMVPGTPDSPNLTLTRTAQLALKTGQFTAVPLMMGGARNELRLYVGYLWQASKSNPANAINAQTLGGWLSAIYPGKLANADTTYAQMIEAEYKPQAGWPSESAVPAALGSLMSDFIPTIGINNCLYLQVADAVNVYSAKFQKIPLYQFEFADEDALVAGVGIAKPYPDFALGSVHSAALNYFFPSYSNNSKINAPELKSQSRELASNMVRYWANFAKSGVPDAHWPLYAKGKTVMRWQPGNTGVYDASVQHKCAFWSAIYLQLQ